MVQVYLYTENEVASFNISKVVVWTDMQTNRHTDSTEIIIYPHTRMVMIIHLFGITYIPWKVD